jgi:hypothetical protein
MKFSVELFEEFACALFAYTEGMAHSFSLKDTSSLQDPTPSFEGCHHFMSSFLSLSKNLHNVLLSLMLALLPIGLLQFRITWVILFFSSLCGYPIWLAQHYIEHGYIRKHGTSKIQVE